MDKKIMIGINILNTLILSIFIASITFGFAEYKFVGKNKIMQESDSPKFIISNEISTKLDEMYMSSEKEFALCADVKQYESYNEVYDSLEIGYQLMDIEDINFYGSDYSRQGYCTEGSLHSHPKGSCKFSNADIYSFKDRIKKGEFFAIIMCGEDEFYYITRNDFSESRMLIE